MTQVPSLRVAIASPEIAPFAKTGGLADVLGSLPVALKRFGVNVSLIMPAYRSVLQGDFSLKTVGTLDVPIAQRKEKATLLKAMLNRDIPVYFIRADNYFDRDYLYTTPEGDYPDNAERFTFFARAILEVLKLAPPSILHCHDWQSALAVAFLKAQPHLYPQLASMKTVFTVHNLGYQGLFSPIDWYLLGLDRSFFTLHYLEFYGRINFLKGGLVFADAISTVSPTYAEEIKTPEQGFGLDGVFRERAADLMGILNGVDYEMWNLETDPHLAKNYNIKSLTSKKANKADLQRRLNLPIKPSIPLLGMVSRLADQKGFDLLETAMDRLLSRSVQLVILGTGERLYRDLLAHIAECYPEKVAVAFTFDDALAHRIIAGADFVLMPSLYEPGGLTQLYGLRYGTVPIVRAVGGLKDTVDEFDAKTGEGTGVLFAPYSAAAFLEAADHALAIFRRKELWAKLMKNAMTADFSWERSAQAYVKLYRKVLERR
ncbi:MAG: glycogen synthase GlgA [Chloroflexota bacterium]